MLDALQRHVDTRNSGNSDVTDAHKTEAKLKQHHQDGSAAGQKQQVIIHSSPFLRCIQTSIGISAGISQYESPGAAGRNRSRSPLPRTAQRGPFRTSSTDGKSLHLETIPEPSDNSTTKNFDHHSRLKRQTLRIDAFLGEWMSPDYFESITPPPNSTMMVASAKADLLRRADSIDVTQNQLTARGNFPGGWARRSITEESTYSKDENSSRHTGNAAESSTSRRDRASSHGSLAVASARSHRRWSTSAPTSIKFPDGGGYVAPVPGYAISASDPIPLGYVAHARDACVNVDYQWDSVREPQNWGDGGEYGEEWSAMHRRFRRGVNNMVSWYKNPRAGGSASSDESSSDSKLDDGKSVVLVLVTHGAGCNALIGALTNQPILMDVSIASLTMFARKDLAGEPLQNGSNGHSSSSGGPGSRFTGDLGLSELYEVKLLASTEHLQPRVNPARLPTNLSSQLGQSGSDHRRRDSPVEPTGLPHERLHGVSSALGSIRRSSSASRTIHTPVQRATTPSSSLSGLWSRETALSDTRSEDRSSPSDDPVPDLANAMPRISTAASAPSSHDGQFVASPVSAPARQLSSHGLWGSAASSAHIEREQGSKRRWTVDEKKS